MNFQIFSYQNFSNLYHIKNEYKIQFHFMSIFKMRQSKLEKYWPMFFGGEFNIICPPKLITEVPKLMNHEAI